MSGVRRSVSLSPKHDAIVQEAARLAGRSPAWVLRQLLEANMENLAVVVADERKCMDDFDQEQLPF